MSYAHYFRAKGVFVGAAFIVIGSFMMFSVSREWLVAMQSRGWQPVEAVIVVSRQIEATAHGSEGRTYQVPELEFRYRYEVGDRSYESGALSFTKKSVDVRDIPAFVERHPKGARLTVYHDSKRPERVVVERGAPAVGILFVLMPGMFVALGPLNIWGSLTGAIVRFCERRGLRYR